MRVFNIGSSKVWNARLQLSTQRHQCIVRGMSIVAMVVTELLRPVKSFNKLTLAVATAMMQRHALLRRPYPSSAAFDLNRRSTCSTLNAASRDVLVTRAQQQQPRPRRSFSKFTTAEKQWRWFGFHAIACSQQPTAQTEYISLAVYDLESGDFYSTLINPKLHNPGYRFTSARLKGRQCVAMLHSALESGRNKGRGAVSQPS